MKGSIDIIPDSYERFGIPETEAIKIAICQLFKNPNCELDWFAKRKSELDNSTRFLIDTKIQLCNFKQKPIELLASYILDGWTLHPEILKQMPITQ